MKQQYLRVLLQVFLALQLMVVGSAALAENLTGNPDQIAARAAEDADARTPPPAPDGGAFFSNLENTARQLSQRFNSGVHTQLSAAGMGFAQRLTAPALALAGALALLYLLYETLMYLGSKNGSMLTVLFDVGVPAIIGALLISNYTANLAMFNDLLDLFRNIAGNPTGSLMRFYGAVLGMISKAMDTSWETMKASFSFTDWKGMGSAALDLILTSIFILVILFIVFSSMAEILALLLLGPFLYAVGVAFGPLLLAGIVTPWTRDYVTKWIGFIVLSAIVTGVLTLIISIAVTVFTSLGFADFVTGRPTATTLGMVAILLMSVNSLISQAPAIASAMVPGALGAKGAGGATITAGVQKAGQKMAKNSPATANAGAVKTGAMVKTAFQKMRPPKPPTP